jgi:PAS domain S-box-containing protein
MDDQTPASKRHPPLRAASHDAQFRTQQRRRSGGQRVARRYQAVLELDPDATVVVDHEGCIRLVNRQTEVLFGYARQDLLGQPVERLLPERVQAVHQRHRAEYVAAPWTRPMGANLPLYGRRRDGSEFPVAVSLAPLVDGDETFVIASIRDASDLHQAQAANEELRRLQALTDTALAHLDLDDLLSMLLPRIRDVLQADQVTILLLDTDGTALTVRAELRQEDDTPAWQQQPVGVGFAGRIAASRTPLVVDDLSTFPLMRPRLRQSLRSAVGVPLLAEEHLLGVLCIGTVARRHFAPQDVALLEQAAARITTAIERSRLFAAEQQARQEAEQSRARWQAAMESTPELVIVCDADLRITYVNPAYALLRGGPADLSVPAGERPTRYGLFLHDGVRPFPVEHLPLTRAVREAWPVHEVEMLVRPPGGHAGEERLVVWEAAPMYSADGAVVGAVAIGHDVTERRQVERERDAAQARAQQRAEELDRMFEAMADGVALYDADGREVRTNAALQRLLRLDLAPPDYAQLPLQQRMALFAARDDTGTPLTTEEGPLPRALAGTLASAESMDVRSQALDGRELELSISAAPLRDAAGHVAGAVAIFHNHTALNRLARDQARQAEELQRIFEGIAEGLVVYDADGQVTRTNGAARRLLGLDAAPPGIAQLRAPHRALQMAVRDAQGRLLTAEDLPLLRVLRGQSRSGVEEQDMQVRTWDGREVNLHTSVAALRDTAGRLVGAVTILSDQTVRTQLEHAVAEQAEQLNRIVEATGEGLVVYDAQGQVVRTNAAARRLLGWDAAPPDYPDLPLDERIARYAPRDAQGQLLTSQAWRALRAQRDAPDASGPPAPEAFDLGLRTLDGRELEVSANFALLRDADGHVVGGVLLLSDRTERNRLAREWENARSNEQTLRELNERLDTFITTAAHDLRQPVAVTKMALDMAQRRIAQVAASVRGAAKQALPFIQVENDLLAIERSLDRLWRLMQQLLDVARARQGALVLNRQLCDLVALVRVQVEEQRLLTPERTLTLDLPAVEAPSGVGLAVHADADRLSQVLSNFLSNAVRYAPEDQPIEVSLHVEQHAHVRDAGRLARVSVRDHGPGIAPEDQATIWDRFQRAHNADEAKGGLGLGLYIARTIVELHGGEVGVNSTFGEGSTFWFTLPLGDTPAAVGPDPAGS